jgi:RimJ/RimL family protein N-acetyltransferase
MPDTYLQTERVFLRHYRAEDFEKLMELNSDPEVVRFFGGVPLSREKVADGDARTLSYQKKYDGKFGVFIAELAASREFMGWFLMRPDRKDIDNTRVLELGYRLKKKFWGVGFATEVSLALLEKAFRDFGAERVFGQADAENTASRRVLEKVGLRFEREFVDSENNNRTTAFYQLNRLDWEKALSSRDGRCNGA